MMTVRDLKAALIGADDNLLIVLAADEEGNTFFLLHQVDRCHYDEQAQEVTEERSVTWSASLKPAILLWPARP